MSATDTKDKSLTNYRYKHPVFDGENPKEFKDFWDNVFATLEMDDMKEYATDSYKKVTMPTKADTEYDDDDDEKDNKVIEKAKKNKLIRKEMKKAKAHMVKVTKGYANRLVMEAEMPYKSLRCTEGQVLLCKESP